MELSFMLLMEITSKGHPVLLFLSIAPRNVPKNKIKRTTHYLYNIAFFFYGSS